MSERRAAIFGRSMPIRTFAIQVAVLLAVFTVAIFLGIYVRTEMLVNDTVKAEASSFIDLIVDTRAWNANHGGVWVLKTEGVASNPYLRVLGVEPDTRTVSGQTLTLRNPAIMTNEISQITQQRDLVTFRLTSLKPVNPNDAPDAWERTVLTRFETDQTPVTRVEFAARGRQLRMMRPLIVESSCLRCHATQGYKVGDIRGAVSVTVPMAAFDASLRRNALTLVGLCVLVIVAGGGMGSWLVRRLKARIEESEERLEYMARTDELTRIANRRAVFERLDAELARNARGDSRTGVIEADIDLFKSVNDAHGHAAGDCALREIAMRQLDTMRKYDTLGRIGGEEFLVIMPDCNESELSAVAERLRHAVGGQPITCGNVELTITVSLGATLSKPGDTADSVVARADRALYAAKAAGRNRVETSF